jgi:hypothetical protein
VQNQTESIVRGERKYIVILVIAGLAYLANLFFEPREPDWSITFYYRDKIPYGTFALNYLLPDFLEGRPIHHSHLTFYEWMDSIPPLAGVMSFSIVFNPPREDVEALLRHVEQGGHAWIAAEYITGIFADTLGIYTTTHITEEFHLKSDSLSLTWTDTDTTSISGLFRKEHVRSYFTYEPDKDIRVLATDKENHAMMLHVRHGKGSFTLSSVPMIFTNINLLASCNSDFLAQCFSYMPAEHLYWTAYYQLGKQEIQSPLRFVLSQEPLRWAYYTAMGAVFLFMLFASRRTQRPIPVIHPPANTTLEFVRTIARLYLLRSDHKRIAEKRIAYYLETLRNRLLMPGLQPDENHVKVVSRKTGHPPEVVRQLFDLIRSVWNKERLTEKELKTLSQKLDELRIT